MKKKVLFHQNGYLNGELAYEAGKVYEIDDTLGSASRWLKRGAEFVFEAEAEAEVKAEVEETVANEESKEENKKVKKVKGL